MNRKTYFDITKIIAAYAIVILHFSCEVRYRLSGAIDNKFLTAIVFENLSRWAVPVFIMISGALFLGRDIPVKQIIKKYVVKLVLLYLICSFIYAAYDSRFHRSFLNYFLKPKMHLWFIPMIIALYISIPVLREIVKNDKVTKYMIILSFCFVFCYKTAYALFNDFLRPSIKEVGVQVLEKVGDLDIGTFLGFVTFYIMGYYLDNTVLSKTRRKLIYFVGILGILSMIVLNYTISYKTGIYFNHYGDEIRVTTFLFSIAFFVLMKYAFKELKVEETLKKTISSFSKLTLGVYLIHPLVIDIYFDYIDNVVI